MTNESVLQEKGLTERDAETKKNSIFFITQIFLTISYVFLLNVHLLRDNLSSNWLPLPKISIKLEQVSVKRTL